MSKRTERWITMLISMQAGDLRPLAEAIILGQRIDRLILFYLAGMINSGEIIAKGRITVRRPRGRPKQSDRFARDQLAVWRYQELRKNLSSEKAFQKAATAFKMTDASLRKALTGRRNSEK